METTQRGGVISGVEGLTSEIGRVQVYSVAPKGAAVSPTLSHKDFATAAGMPTFGLLHPPQTNTMAGTLE